MQEAYRWERLRVRWRFDAIDAHRNVHDRFSRRSGTNRVDQTWRNVLSGESLIGFSCGARGKRDAQIRRIHRAHVDTGAGIGELIELPRLGTVGQGPTVVGREAGARLALRYNGPGTSITLLSVPSLRNPTAIGLHEGRVVVHLTMTVEDGLITRGDVLLDPDKLADLNLILDT